MHWKVQLLVWWSSQKFGYCGTCLANHHQTMRLANCGWQDLRQGNILGCRKGMCQSFVQLHFQACCTILRECLYHLAPLFATLKTCRHFFTAYQRSMFAHASAGCLPHRTGACPREVHPLPKTGSLHRLCTACSSRCAWWLL